MIRVSSPEPYAATNVSDELAVIEEAALTIREGSETRFDTYNATVPLRNISARYALAKARKASKSVHSKGLKALKGLPVDRKHEVNRTFEFVSRRHPATPLMDPFADAIHRDTKGFQGEIDNKYIGTATNRYPTEWAVGDFELPEDDLRYVENEGQTKLHAYQRINEHANSALSSGELEIVTFEEGDLVMASIDSFHRSPINQANEPFDRVFWRYWY